MKLEQLFSLRSALIVSALILTITFLYPLSGDNALYMYMADLLLKGHLPYVGSWDVNYPGIVFLHAIHVGAFGPATWGFHLFDVIIQLVGCYYLYRLTRLLGGGTYAAWFAAVVSALYYVAGGLALCGERDVYVAILLVAAMYYLLSDGAELMTPALCVGFALLIRPTALAYLAAIAVWMVVARGERRISYSLKLIMIALLPLGLFIIIYAAIGHLHTFFEATFLYNTAVYARIGMGLSDLKYLLEFWPLLIASPMGLLHTCKTARSQGLLLILVLAAALVSLIPVYRFDYHFHPMMLVLIVVSVIGWGWVIDRMSQRSNGAIHVTAAIAVMVVVIFSIVRGSAMMHALRTYASTGDHTSVKSSVSASPIWGSAVQDSLSDYIRRNIRRGETAQFLTAPMHVPLGAGVEPANRFTSIYNLVWRSSKTNDLVPMQHEWRKEFMADVIAARYIISSRSLPDHVFNNGYLPDDVVGAFPDLERLIEMEYDSVRQFGGYTVYEQKR